MVKKVSAKLLFILAISLLVADQLTKMMVRNLGESVPVIKNIFHITFVMNFGVAFGLLQGYNHIVIWLYLVVLGLIIFFYDRFPKDRFTQAMLFIIIAGILGNFVDRMAFGYVIDFIDFRVWPVFNLADLYLNIGIIGLIGREILKGKSKKATAD